MVKQSSYRKENIILKTLIKFINIILLLFTNTKFEYLLPKKCDILCYDQGKNFNIDIKKIFKSLKIDVLYVRLEKLNLIIACKSLFSKIFNFKLSIKNHYIKHYCHYTQPKIIISTSYLDKSFLYLKKNIKNNYKTVLIQRCPYKITDFKINKIKPEINQNYLFNETSARIIKKKINSKEFILGSFQNNIQKKIKNNKNFLLIISGYKKKMEKISRNGQVYYLNAIHEKKLVKTIINIFSKKYEVKVLLKPDTRKNDYLNFLGIHRKHVITNNGNPYKTIDKSNLVITFADSTMGYETISRKVKYVFIPRKKIPNLNRFYIYQNKFDKIKLKKFLLSFIKMNKKIYFNKMKIFDQDIAPFNHKNTLLIKNLYNLIN